MKSKPAIKSLLNHVVEYTGIKIGGICGIVVNPSKLFKSTQKLYEHILMTILNQKPDILITHLSPTINERGLVGESFLTDMLFKCELLHLCSYSH